MFKPDERYLPVKPGTYQTKESVEYLFSKVSNTREHWQKIVDKLKGIYCWSDDLQTSWFEINMQGTIEFHGEGCGYIGKDGTIDTIPKGLYNFWDILNQVQNTENREKFLLHPFTLEGKLTGIPSPWSFIQDERGVVSLKYTAPNVVDWLRQLPGIRFNNTTGRVNDVMGWNPDLHDTPEKAFAAKEVSKETKLSFKHFIPNSGVVEKGYEFQFTHHNVDGSWNIASYSNDRVRIENPYGFTMPNIDLENASYNSTVMPGIVPNTFTWKSEREAQLEDLKRKVRAGFLNATARVENKYRLEINNNFDNPMAKFTVKLVNPVFYTAGLYPGEYKVKAIADGNFIKNIISNQDKSSRNPIGDHFNRGYISGHNDQMDTPDKILAHYRRTRLYFKIKFTHKETGLESDWIDVPYSALTKWEKDSVYDVTDEIMARENQWNIRLYAVRNIIDVNPDGTPVYKLLNQFIIDNFGHPGTYKIKTDFNGQPETSREHILVNYDKLFNQLTSDQREHWDQIKYKLVDYTAPNGQGPFPFFMNEKTFTAQPSDTATYAIKEGLFPNPQYSIIGNAITTTYPDGRVVKEFKNIKIQISGHKPGRWKIGVTDFYYGDVEISKSGEALVEIESLNKAMIDRLEDDYHLGTEITVYSWNDVEIQPQETRQITQSIPYHEFIHFNLTESDIQAEDPIVTRLRNMLNNVTFHALKHLDFLQSTTHARPTYEITLPSSLPSGRYKFRLGTTEFTSNGNTNKLSITNAEALLDNLYQDGTKLTLMEYSGNQVTNISSAVHFTETRRYLKAAIKPLTDTMSITGSLAIQTNGQYEQELRFEANGRDDFSADYLLNIDNLGDGTYEAVAGGYISDGVFRGPLTDHDKQIIKTWDPSTKPTIPVRMLAINRGDNDPGDLYEDEAAMNANRKGFIVQVPNRIVYRNEVERLIAEAKSIMENLKSKNLFVWQLLEDFDGNERARFEQRVYVPKLRNAEDRNIQVHVVGESNTIRLPLTDKSFTLQNHPWVNKPNAPTAEYTLAKLTSVSFELVSIDGVAIPGTPRYDIGVSLCDQYIKRSTLLSRIEDMDITGKIILSGSQSNYNAKLTGNLGKASYGKLPTGNYDIVFRINDQMVKTSPIVNRAGGSTLGNFTNISLPHDTTVERLPRTIDGNITHYRGLRVHHDTNIELASVPITLDNRLTMDDQRAQPISNGDLVNKPVGNAKFDTMWNEADMRVFLVDVSGNVDQRNDRVHHTSYLKTFRRLPKGRYEMSVLHQSYNTPENGHINLQQTGVLKPQSNEYEGRAWAQPYGIEKVTEMNFIGTPPSDDRWKKASIMIPYKKIDLTINSKNKPLVPVDRRLADPFDQYRMVLHVFVAITSYRRNQTDDKYAPFVITSYIEFDQVSLQAFQKVIIGSDEVHFGIPNNRQYIDKVYCPIEPWIMDMSTPGYNKLIWVNRNTVNRSPGTDTQAELVKELMIPRKLNAKLHVEEIGGPRRTKDVQIPIQFHILNADDREYNTTLPELILPRFNRKVNYSYK